MTVFEKIQSLAKKRGKSLQQVAEELGFSSNLFYRWKTSEPKARDLSKVAEYFGTTVDYLLGNIENPELKFYDDKTFDAIAKSFAADNETYTQLFESLPLLSDEELVVVNKMVQSLLELKQKKS